MTLLAATAGSITLVAVKVVHWGVLRSRSRRRARYTEAVADLLTTGATARTVSRARRDGVFVDVIHDYLGLVSGHELERLHLLIDHVDLRRRLRRRGRFGLTAGSRLSALHMLTVIGARGDESFFLALLGSRSATVRLGAAEGLAAISSAAGLEGTLDLLARESPPRALLLADALVSYGPGAVPSLASRLATATVTERAILLRVLGLIGDREAASAVAPFLSDADADVRVAAASSLGSVGTTAVLPALIAATADPDWRVRARVADSLGDLGDPTASAHLSRLLTDSAWWVRQNAARSLGRLPGGRDELLVALAGPDRFAADAAREQLELAGEQAPSATESPLGVAP